MPRVAVGLLLTAALVAGCTSAPPVVQETAAPTAPAPRSSTPSTTTSPPATTTAPSPTATPAPPLSPETVFAKTYDGRNLQQVREIGSTAAYQQYFATFDGDGLTISGRLLVPRGNGPFPAVVLAHGYADPAVYDNTSQMSRERDYLARQGYVTLLVDYRNHAQSSKDPNADATLRLGYAADVINAAKALQQDPRVKPDRIALMGRSMGGGVVMKALIAEPGLVRAASLWASVSSLEGENFNQFVRADGDSRRDVIVQAHGLPEQRPAFWRGVSARPYLSRITEPVLMVHGRLDDTCPPRWARATYAAMRRAGVDSTLEWYDDGHAFGPAFTAAMDRTIRYLDNRLA